MNKNTNSTEVFIVYQKHEEKLAENLSKLFELWGLNPFYCRDSSKAHAHKPYRDYLAEELFRSVLVVLLVSREFEWSKYCQSEAGATITMGKPRIIITIPPVVNDDVSKIAPILEGFNCFNPSPFNANLLRESIKGTLKATLNTLSFKKRNVSNQKEGIEAALNRVEDYKSGSEDERALERRIDQTIKDITDAYAIIPSRRYIVKTWPSIKEESCLQARSSIVIHIKQSLIKKVEPTEVILVGVSLKYSLELITKTLRELADSNEDKAALIKDRKEKKKMKISLFHMNEHSHILWAIRDFDDVKMIKENFDIGWADRKKAWAKLAMECSIELDINGPYGIDYIPPHLGICIDDTTLYSGRCVFEKGGMEQRLLVGEQEYIHYSSAEAHGMNAIKQFKQALILYGNARYNSGVRLVYSPSEWIEHLKDGLTVLPDCGKITLLSQTATKFTGSGLVDEALRLGLEINLHIQNPSQDTPLKIKSHIENVNEHLKDAVKRAQNKKGHIRVFYSSEPAYRAVLIGNELIGYQNYVRMDDELRRGTLRLIVTKASSQFESLKSDLFPDHKAAPNFIIQG
jgi:hypothetical protein